MKVELICFLVNRKLEEMDIKHDDIEVNFTVETECIEAVREIVEDEQTEPSKTKCAIYLKSGESFQIKKNYRKMVLLWTSKSMEDYNERKVNLKPA